MFWIEDVRTVVDANRTDGVGERIIYGADSESDIASLPGPNGRNQGSICFTLQDGKRFRLGTDPSYGINGWGASGQGPV